MDEREKEKLKKDIDILFGDDENVAIATLIEYLPEKKSIEELTEEDLEIIILIEIMEDLTNQEEDLDLEEEEVEEEVLEEDLDKEEDTKLFLLNFYLI